MFTLEQFVNSCNDTFRPCKSMDFWDLFLNYGQDFPFFCRFVAVANVIGFEVASAIFDAFSKEKVLVDASVIAKAICWPVFLL